MIDARHDLRFMAAALAVGRRNEGCTAPNPAVGAVLVREGPAGPVIVGAGVSAPGGRPHAEPLAVAEAGPLARGATCYATLEPCSHFGKTPPCADALIAAGVGGVVVALEDPNPEVAGRGIARLTAAGIPVRSGVRREEAAWDMRGHLSRMSRGRPHVALKLALSAEGGIGRAGAGQVALSGDRSRARSHLLRATHDAIAVGVGTVLADDPQLTCRLPGLFARSPVRVVFDTEARTPTDAALFADTIAVVIVAAEDAPPARVAALAARGAQILAVPRRGERLDLDAAMAALGRHGITTMLLEGGAALASAMVAAELVDEAYVIETPTRLGEASGIVRPFGGATVAALSSRLSIDERSLVGDDLWTHLRM